MGPRGVCDSTDEAILALLRANGRESLAEIGRRVNLSPAAVNRRMKRLEEIGVIRGYTVLLDEASRDTDMSAVVELSVAGNTGVHDIGEIGNDIDDVQAVFTIAGDPDALVWVRAKDIAHLHRTIDRLRRNDRVTGTKTLMVLDSWRRREATQPTDPVPARRSGRFRTFGPTRRA